MNRLVRQVFCSECGAMRIHPHRSRYAICPNGHGRLVPRFTEAQRREAVAMRLPRARRVGRNRFAIAGRKSQYAYRLGSGCRPVTPDQSVAADEVVARHVTATRTLIRVFARRPPRKRQRLTNAARKSA
jgi:hypothetical protein